MFNRNPDPEHTVSDQGSSDPRDTQPIRPGRTGAGFLTGFLETAKGVLSRPKTFFPTMPVEGGFAAPHLFFLLCTAVFILASIGMNLGDVGELDPRLLILVFLAPILPFVDAALLHLIAARLLGGRGSYEATFRVVCYASAVNLFTWVPFVGLLAQIYEIYLAALGLSAVHRIGIGRAFVAVGCTATAFFALALAFVLSMGP
jgi:hypothetical protein